MMVASNQRSCSVIKSTFPMAALLAAVALQGQTPAPNKVGIIHIQQAIVSTRDGQAAVKVLGEKFEPKRKEFESRQSAIAALQQELNKGSNTMSEDRRALLTREIDSKTKNLNRDTEDAQAEYEQEQNRLLNDLGQKMMVVIEKYARENGFSLILDVSSPQTPVLYAANGTEITKEIVELYDKSAPPAPAATKPAASPPATKKSPTGVK
jgi:outer membrane protein